MMLCPLKFNRYEFEGGEECIGAECGFFGGVCGAANLIAERDELTNAINELQKKQPYCYDPEKPLDTLNTVGRYIDELKVERDELEMRVNGLVAELGDAEGTSIILERQRDELINAINELQKKQLYCYNPEAPLDTLRTVGCYIDELKAERDELKKRVGEQQETLDNDCRDLIENDNEICKLTAERDEWKAKAEQAKESSAHSKAQSKTEQLLTEQSESFSDEADSREKLRIVMPRHNGEKYAKLMVKQFDQLIYDDLHDSREKLEADVYNHIAISITPNKEDDGVLAPYATVLEWLDRQKAITERECLVQSVQGADAILTAENAELQTRVDELTAQLHASNAERARLRECLGIATDNAHDLLTLVDESGNVYDRDEGLA